MAATRKRSNRSKRSTNSTLTRQRSLRDWGPKFLRRLALCGNIGEAARYVKIHRSTVYFRRDNDQAFAQLLVAALEDADDRLDAMLMMTPWTHWPTRP